MKSELTDAAIHNYEFGNRSPNKKQLCKITQALGSDISTLVNYSPNSIIEFMQVVFDYENEIKFKPLIEGNTRTLISHDPNFDNFLLEWDEIRKKHYNGGITDEEFDD